MVEEFHYCDSGVFIGFLNQEPKEFSRCKSVLDAAESGQIKVFTSTFTMAEVVYIKNDRLSDEQKEEMIQRLFSNPWIIPIGFDRETAKINRYIVRKFKIKPFDALHLATAIRMKVDYFDTTDGVLLRKVEEVVGSNFVSYPPEFPKKIVLQKPFVKGQTLSLF